MIGHMDISLCLYKKNTLTHLKTHNYKSYRIKKSNTMVYGKKIYLISNLRRVCLSKY